MLAGVTPGLARVALQSTIWLLPLGCELSSVDYLESGRTDGGGVGGARDSGAGHGDGASAPVLSGLGGADASADSRSGSHSDSGSDASSDSPSGHWCGSVTATFCADFDVDPLPSGFLTMSGTFLSLTTMQAVSKPYALLLQVPADSSSGTFSSSLTHSFPNPVTTTMTLSFDFMPVMLTTTASGILFATVDFLGNANAKYSLRLVFYSGQARLEESTLTPPDIYHPFFDVTLNASSRVSLAVTFAGGAAQSATVSVAGVPVGGAQTLAPAANVDWHPNLLMGAVFGGNPQTGWVFQYDDIVFDYQ
jgi:hypothetical protein